MNEQKETHRERIDKVKPARKCTANDLFLSSKGLECGNCGYEEY